MYAWFFEILYFCAFFRPFSVTESELREEDYFFLDVDSDLACKWVFTKCPVCAHSRYLRIWHKIKFLPDFGVRHYYEYTCHWCGQRMGRTAFFDDLWYSKETGKWERGHF